MKEKNKKICIVGAGPGGLATAEALREKGYTDITVFEKHNHVGGQALSNKYKIDETHELVYELGSLQPMSTSTGVMRKLLKRYNMHVGKNEFSGRAVRVKLYDCTNHKIEIDFTKSFIGYPITFKNLWWLTLDAFKLIPFVFRYRKLARDGYTSLSDKNLAELTLPYEEWIDKQQFRLISRELKFVLGSMLTFANPAYKADLPSIKFFKLLLQCLKFPPRYINGKVVQMQEGYQELWNRVSKTHNVKLNAHIKHITRDEKGIHVAMENNEQFDFDILIVACTPVEAKQFLDINQEEEDIVKKTRFSSGWRVAFLAKGFPKDAAYGFYEPSFSSEFPCRLQVIIPEGKVSDDVWLYTGVLSYDKKENVDLQLAEAEKFLQKNFNAQVIKWLNTVYWSYYTPYFSINDIDSYKKIESMQGKHNTYYISALLSGGTHAIVASYAYQIVKQHF